MNDELRGKQFKSVFNLSVQRNIFKLIRTFQIV